MGRKPLSEVERPKPRPKPGKAAATPAAAAITALQVARLAGLNLSIAQVVALKCIGGEPLTPDELGVFRTLAGNDTGNPRDGGYQEVWISAGRRGGKSLHVAAPCAVAAALDPTVAGKLSVGERGRVLMIGPTLAHTQQLFDGVKGILAALQVPHHPRDAEREIELLSTPVLIQAVVGDHLGPRSGTAVFAVVDEAALLDTNEGAAAYDVELFASLRPSLATTRGKLLVISSPWMQAGEHFRITTHERGRVNGRRLALWGPTETWNPSLPPSVTRELEPDARRWEREYGAVAGNADDAFLRASDVDAAVDVGRRDSPPMPGVRYCAGFDAAFRRDRSALVIAHREYRAQPGRPPSDVVVIDAIRTWEPRGGAPIPFDDLIRDVTAITTRYHQAKLARDSFGGDPIGAAFKQRGVSNIEVSMSSAEQARRFDMLATKIAAGTLRLPDEPIAVRELKQLRLRLHSGGRVQIAAPARTNMHDDVADALCLACEAAMQLTPAGDIRCRTSFVWLGSVGASPDPVTRWEKRVIWADGSERWEQCAPPQDTPAWHTFVREMTAAHMSTPEIEEWREAQQRAERRVLTVGVDRGESGHGNDAAERQPCGESPALSSADKAKVDAFRAFVARVGSKVENTG